MRRIVWCGMSSDMNGWIAISIDGKVNQGGQSSMPALSEGTRPSLHSCVWLNKTHHHPLIKETSGVLDQSPLACMSRNFIKTHFKTEKSKKKQKKQKKYVFFKKNFIFQKNTFFHVFLQKNVFFVFFLGGKALLISMFMVLHSCHMQILHEKTLCKTIQKTVE